MGDLRDVAGGVFWLESGMFSTNVYLAGTTLIDAGTKSGANKILRQLDGREVEAK